MFHIADDPQELLKDCVAALGDLTRSDDRVAFPKLIRASCLGRNSGLPPCNCAAGGLQLPFPSVRGEFGRESAGQGTPRQHKSFQEVLLSQAV